ncbi:MAG TPA: DNA primase [Ignavibacteriaceae bacterium]|nr:DNA primase [Ignavibacteriaceae bacterium]
MRIPESKIEEIRSGANIVDVISEYVQLRKRGKNYIGLCPFHSEKTPSFTVSEEKQIYHCFGCHAGGNVFKFLMEFEKISFVESVQEIAEKLGITLEYDDEGGAERQSEQELLYEINTTVAKYFSENLLSDERGEIAREYFDKRQIKIQAMRAFGLGYSLPGRENLVNYLTEKKINIDKALALGLIGSYEDGRLYDKFSGRIIFPIFSPNGRVVAFAGRILDPDQKSAKYLNSPESLIYIKGRTLYGLSFAKDEIRKQDKAIIVEGYMDLISLYQSGIKNVVAVSGTALTEEQVQLLSRYTKNVVLLFDSDTAGIKASMRSIEILLKKDMDIKIASVPDGEDPDSYVNKYGKEKFEEIIQKSKNFLEYQSAQYESEGMFSDPAKMTQAIRDLVKPIAIINDELKRTVLLKNIAKKFNLREKLLEEELYKALNEINKNQVREQGRKSRTQREKENISVLSEGKATPINESSLRNEKEIMELLFSGSREIIDYIFQHLTIDDFIVEIHKNLAEVVYESYNNDENISLSALLDKIEKENENKYINELVSDKHSISDRWEDVSEATTDNKFSMKSVSDVVRKKRISVLDRLIRENFEKLQAEKDENKLREFMKTENELKNERNNLIKENQKPD